MVTDEVPPAAPLPMATQPCRLFRKLTQASPTPFGKDPTSVHFRPPSVVCKRYTGPQCHKLTKKSVGLRKSAPVRAPKPKPFRCNIGGETSRQCAPPSIVMSRKSVVLGKER